MSVPSSGSKIVSVLYRLIMPLLLLVPRHLLLLFKDMAVMGEKWFSDVYLVVAGCNKFAAKALFWVFQILADPSSNPAQMNCEFFEKTMELTGALPVTY